MAGLKCNLTKGSGRIRAGLMKHRSPARRWALLILTAVMLVTVLASFSSQSFVNCEDVVCVALHKIGLPPFSVPREMRVRVG